jgi:hypothetical protein
LSTAPLKAESAVARRASSRVDVTMTVAASYLSRASLTVSAALFANAGIAP